MKNEPVLTGAVVSGAIMSIALFSIAMGWLNWGDAQTDAFESMLLALSPLVLTLLGGWYGRQRVTPVHKIGGDK